jgi:hypothetical protein
MVTTLFWCKLHVSGKNQKEEIRPDKSEVNQIM